MRDLGFKVISQQIASFSCVPHQLRETTQKANFKTQGQEREYYLSLSTAVVQGQTSSLSPGLFCLPPHWFPGFPLAPTISLKADTVS